MNGLLPVFILSASYSDFMPFLRKANTVPDKAADAIIPLPTKIVIAAQYA